MFRIFLAFACLLLGSTSGCREVDHCPKGELRCLGGLCEQGECDFDLQCVVRTSGEALCGKRIRDDRYDFGDKGKGDATPIGVAKDCECEAPSVCAADGKTCVNYCESVDKVPGSGSSPEVIFCEHEEGQASYTYAEICKRQCENNCQRWSQFCGFTCEPGYCESQDVTDACEAQCPSAQADARACLTRACNTVRDQTCSKVLCPDTQAPASCENLVCKNTCGSGADSGEWAGDGFCDDGDLYSSDFSECDWGSDCVDCGPRMGPAPVPQPNGGVCAYHSGCIGHSRTLATNGAWCLRLDEVQEGLARCMPDCSGSKVCPTGYECVTVVDDTNEPVVSEDGRLMGKACVPTMCGT